MAVPKQNVVVVAASVVLIPFRVLKCDSCFGDEGLCDNTIETCEPVNGSDDEDADSETDLDVPIV